MKRRGAPVIGGLSPAHQFISDRVWGISDADQFDAAMRVAMLALLKSDLPLDADMRRRIADVWEAEHRTTKEASLAKGRALIWAVNSIKEHWRGRMSMAEIEEQLAHSLGYKDGDSLRTTIQRARRSLKRK